MTISPKEHPDPTILPDKPGVIHSEANLSASGIPAFPETFVIIQLILGRLQLGGNRSTMMETFAAPNAIINGAETSTPGSSPPPCIRRGERGARVAVNVIFRMRGF